VNLTEEAATVQSSSLYCSCVFIDDPQL